MKVIIDCCFGNVLPKGSISTESSEKYGCTACEYIQDNIVHRCNKFVCVAGTTPDGENVNEWRCSESWVPTLLVENSMTNRGQTDAIHQGYKETMTRQDKLNNILGLALEQSKQNKVIGEY